MRDYRLHRTPALADVAQDTARQAYVGVRVHIDLDVHHVAQLLVFEDQDAVDDDYLRRLHAHGFRRTVVVDERVDRVLDGDVVLQRLDVVDQHLRVERLRMVVIEFRAFLVGQLGVRLVIVVVAERHDVVAYEGLLQAYDERGLSRAGSSGDSDYGNFHSVSL